MGLEENFEVETDCERKRELKDGGLGSSALLAWAVLTVLFVAPSKRANRNLNRGVRGGFRVLFS